MFTKEERLIYAYTFIKFQQNDLLLDFWQDYYLKSYSRFIAVVKSRRVGWSFICSMKGLVKALDPDRVGYTKQFVSYNEEDAVEKINYAKQFYESIPDNAKKKIVSCNKSQLILKDENGVTESRLISIPCRPPRGKGGDISLDEYAIYNAKMQKLVYDAALPVISRGGCLEMGSSPLGKIGQFYDIVTDKETYDFERYNIPWWFCRDLCVNVPDAVKECPNLPTHERVEKYGTKILKKIFQNCDFDTFTQEYECDFIDDSESYITLDLIYSCVPGKRDGDLDLSLCEKMSDEEYWEYNRDIDFQTYHDADSAILNYDPEKHGTPLYFGFDVGREHDASDIYLIGKLNGKKRSFCHIEMRGATYDQQLDTVKKLYHELPIYRGCFDMTGLGGKFVRDGLAELGDKVVGIDFTQQNKEILAMDVKRGLEQKEFLLENDKSFHQQIHSIKRSSSGGKFFHFDASRDSKGHADAFWSWSLANHAWENSEGDSENFYHEYARKKREVVVQSSQRENTDTNSSGWQDSNGSNIVIPRGRSLQSVMRGIQRANRK